MREWEVVAREEYPWARSIHDGLGEKEWMGYCRSIVESGGGRFEGREAKLRKLIEKVEEFLPCVPEHGSRCGADDENGVDQGGERRFGCLIPHTFRFDRTTCKTISLANAPYPPEPAPYIEDLYRDWDLITFLSLPEGKQRTYMQYFASTVDPDWIAYAVLAAKGICPVEIESDQPLSG